MQGRCENSIPERGRAVEFSLRLFRSLRRALNWTLAIAVGVLICPGPSDSQGADEFPEYQLKAAFLFNFARFVQWPDKAFSSADSPLVIGVLGEDPFGQPLRDIVENKSVSGRKLAIKYLKANDSLAGCHLLFISRSEKDRAGTVLAQLAGQNTLTVADFDGFARMGGMMNLFVSEKNVQFEINVEATERAQLKVSSKLGALGIVVKTEVGKVD